MTTSEVTVAAALVVMAKAPVPGRSKTRLCPPCTLQQAALVADAALRDTLAVAAKTRAARIVLALDGPVPAYVDPSVEVVAQRGDGLGERLTSAFADVDGPALVIGMDTPQVGPDLLDRALGAVAEGRTVLGPAADGGWWALGLRRCPPGAFAGVPMSEPSTGRRQEARLRACGLDPRPLPEMRDVDHWSDALLVASEAPAGHFAGVVRHLERRRSSRP